MAENEWFSFPPGGDSTREEVIALLQALLPFAGDAMKKRIQNALKLISAAASLNADGTSKGGDFYAAP